MTWIYKVINATHNKQNTKILDNFVPQITLGNIEFKLMTIFYDGINQ